MNYELLDYDGYAVFFGSLADLRSRLIQRRHPFNNGMLSLESWEGRKDVVALYFVDQFGSRLAGLEPVPTKQFLLDLYGI